MTVVLNKLPQIILANLGSRSIWAPGQLELLANLGSGQIWGLVQLGVWSDLGSRLFRDLVELGKHGEWEDIGDLYLLGVCIFLG